MRASNQLTSQSSHQINVSATRKLPSWSPLSGWSANQPTRSIAWAFADACRNSEYGAKLADNRVALQQLYALDQTWAARGDYYDCVHDSASTLWDVLTQIARAGRAKPYLQGGVVCIVRDQPATVPVALFSPRNTIQNSSKLTYAMTAPETVDSVRIKYFDREVWAWRTILCALPGSSAAIPAEVTLNGVTERAQAYREGLYMAACNKYRRRTGSRQTEMEGLIPSPMDLVALVDDLPGWGQGGDIVGISGSTVTTSEPLDFSAGGNFYMGLRRRDGSLAGPYLASAGPSSNQAVLTGLDILLDTDGFSRERTQYAFGPSSQVYARARVLSIRPQDERHVELSYVLESDAVHTADGTLAVPSPVAWQLPAKVTAPVVSGVVASVLADQPDQLSVSWAAAANADRYQVEISADNSTWTQVADTSATAVRVPIQTGTSVYVRVRAMGAAAGEWATPSGNVQTQAQAAPPKVSALVATGGVFQVALNWSIPTVSRTDLNYIEIWASTSNNLSSAVRLSIVPWPATSYVHPGLVAGQNWYYWLRIVSSSIAPTSNDFFPIGSSSGVHAQVSSDPSSLLAQLNSALTSQQLASDLAAQINQLDGGISSLNLSPALRGLLDGNIGHANQIALAEIDSILDGFDVGQRVRWLETLTGATISVDPLTGKISLLATANVTTDVEARLMQAEVNVNAALGTLTDTVSTLGIVQGNLSSAQSQLVQLSDSITGMASQVYVDNAVSEATGQITVSAANAINTLANNAINAALDQFEAGEAQRDLAANVAIAGEKIQANADASAALAQKQALLLASVGANASAIDAEQTARASADSAEATARLALASRVSGVESAQAAITQNQQTLSDQTQALAQSTTQLSASSVSAAANANTLAVQAIEAALDAFEAGRSLQDVVGGLAVAQEQIVAQVGASAALAQRFSALVATVSGVAAAVQEERRARVSADEAEAQARESLRAELETTLGSTVAAAESAASAAAASDSAHQSAEAANSSKVAAQAAAVAAGDNATAAAESASSAASESDSAHQSAEAANSSKVAAQAAAGEAGTSATASAESASSAESARDSATGAATAAARSLESVQAIISETNFAAVKQQSETTASTVGDILAKHSIKTMAVADGIATVAGIELISGEGGVSKIGMLADRFLWYLPDGSGVPVQALVLGNVNGNTVLVLNGDLVADGSITARHINVESISALSQDIGIITAGVLRNQAGDVVFNMSPPDGGDFINLQGKIRFSKSGEAFIARGIVSPPVPLASGTVGDQSGSTAGLNIQVGDEFYIHTGFNAGGGAWNEVMDMYRAGVAARAVFSEGEGTQSYHNNHDVWIVETDVLVTPGYVSDGRPSPVWNPGKIISASASGWATSGVVVTEGDVLVRCKIKGLAKNDAGWTNPVLASLSWTLFRG